MASLFCNNTKNWTRKFVKIRVVVICCQSLKLLSYIGLSNQLSSGLVDEGDKTCVLYSSRIYCFNCLKLLGESRKKNKYLEQLTFQWYLPENAREYESIFCSDNLQCRLNICTESDKSTKPRANIPQTPSPLRLKTEKRHHKMG